MEISKLSDNNLISVVIPAFNAEETLLKCINSLRDSICVNPEVIVVDDCSSDNTAQIAEKNADIFIRFQNRKGAASARLSGAETASSDIIVFVDSDVLVKKETLSFIRKLMKLRKDFDAVTGKLEEKPHYKDYFSAYKNVYMHHVYSSLPERVDFLYGSIFALRRNVLKELEGLHEYPEDTLWGRKLTQNGKFIHFSKDIEVTHIKKFNLLTLLLNDFRISHGWGSFLVKTRIWEHGAGDGYAFAHASWRQIAGLLFSVILFLSIVLLNLIDMKHSDVNKCKRGFLKFIVSLSGASWLFTQYSLLKTMFRHLGVLKGLAAIPLTWIDNIVMTAGGISGLLSEIHAVIKIRISKLNIY